jgi:CSLREA domain-containing protein
MNLRKAVLTSMAGLLISPTATAFSFTVNTSADDANAHDANPGDGICLDSLGACTLRAAIEEANANNSIDYIAFDDVLADAVITLAASQGPLPNIVEQVFIGASSIPAYNRDATLLRDAPPQITLDGSLLSGSTNSGLAFDGAGAAGSAVTALSIVGFSSHAIVASSGAHSIIVQRNYLGVRPNGTAGGNGGNGFRAFLSNSHLVGKSRNAEGTAFTGLGNVIANNGQSGVRLNLSTGNRVNGNLIGISPTGTGDRGNGGYGVHATGDFNSVGDRLAALQAGNFIAGNELGGLLVEGNNNFIKANTLGKGETGGFISSEGDGIALHGSGNYIGDSAGNGNKIYEHQGDGIRLGTEVVPANNNYIIGNQVGSAGGQFPLLLSGNRVGILVDTGNGNLIDNNFVLNSQFDGILVDGDANSIYRNQTGYVDSISGPIAEPNAHGLYVRGNNNTIGGVGLGNYIAGNQDKGAWLIGNNNYFAYNHVGVNNDYEVLANGSYGVLVADADNMTITSNVIGGNPGEGINGAYMTQSLIADNFIGVAPDGGDIGNGLDGIEILDAIAVEIRNNRISFNGGDGIRLLGAAALGNSVFQNLMHSNGGIGINLGTDGVTPNDLGDADSGPNRLLNFPQVEQVHFNALANPPMLTVHYRVTAEPDNADYPLFIDFYWSDMDEPAQGRYFIGTDFSYTEPGKEKVHVLNLPVETAGGWLTGTSLDQGGNTSELASRVLFGLPPGELIFKDGFE